MNFQAGDSDVAAVEEPARPSGRSSWRDLFPDPRVVWMVFRRNIWVFSLSFLAVAAAVAAWTAVQVPIYSATASLLVQPQADHVVAVEPVAGQLPATDDVVDTQVRLMQSPGIALRVADAYAAVHPEARPVNEGGRRMLADRMRGMVSINRSGATFVIEVSGRSSDPEEAAEVANLYVNQYVDADRQAKVGTTEDANIWLQQRTAELAREATAADAALQAYKIRTGLISTNGGTLAEQEISTLNQQIADAQAVLAEKQGRLNAARSQLRQGSGGADVGAALGSGTIGTLRAREAEFSANVAQQEARYGPLHPDLKKAESELADVRSQIQKEINRILSNLEAEVQVAASRLGSLRASQARSTGALSSNTAAAVGLAELQRKADAAKAIYETFLNRSRETGAQQGLQRADSRVASLATTPGAPDFPNHKLALTFALLGGLLAGLLAVAVTEYLQGGVRTKDDVEQRLGVRYAGAVPTLKSTLGNLRATEPPHEYIVSHPFSVFSEAFRSLRAFLFLGSGMAAGASRAVAIASPLPQEGKTTTAVCLARTAAMSGAATVLVDCDLRRRGSSELLGNRNSNGLYDYFNGSATLDQALFLDQATGLYLLGTSDVPHSAQDPLTSENMERLIAELRQRFQVIVIDTAPILGVADARVVAAAADRVLLITRWRRTSMQACEAAIDLLLDASAKISGVALTQVDIRKYASTGHTDAYGYQKKFKGYYTN